MLSEVESPEHELPTPLMTNKSDDWSNHGSDEVPLMEVMTPPAVEHVADTRQSLPNLANRAMS